MGDHTPSVFSYRTVLYVCVCAHVIVLTKVRPWAGDLLVWLCGDPGISRVRRLQEGHHGQGGLSQPDHAP